MNQQLYRRSRLYRALFRYVLAEKKRVREETMIDRLYRTLLEKASEKELEEYSDAVIRGDHKAALEAQEAYFDLQRAIREYNKEAIISKYLYG